MEAAEKQSTEKVNCLQRMAHQVSLGTEARRKNMNYRTEDEVRDSAKLILGFDKTEPKVKQGTGQITTFNQLGFKGVIDKPDG